MRLLNAIITVALLLSAHVIVSSSYYFNCFGVGVGVLMLVIWVCVEYVQRLLESSSIGLAAGGLIVVPPLAEVSSMNILLGITTKSLRFLRILITSGGKALSVKLIAVLVGLSSCCCCCFVPL